MFPPGNVRMTPCTSSDCIAHAVPAADTSMPRPIAARTPKPPASVTVRGAARTTAPPIAAPASVTASTGRHTRSPTLIAASSVCAMPRALNIHACPSRGAACEAANTTLSMPPTATKAAAPAPTFQFTGSRGVRRERMTKLRARIAERLVMAKNTAAMLTTFNECDMSEVMRLRAEHKEAFEKRHGTGLGFMGFFMKAVVSGLEKYPRVNASIVGDEIEYHDYIDVSVAVGTDKGLVVPVVRNVQGMSIAQIEMGIKELAVKARDGRLSVDDMTGGTFTITNGGVYGSLMSTPILNPPQSGILGMHAIKNRAVECPKNPGHVVIRPMMYLALSYDHRIVDGAEAVGFLVQVKNAIEKPERLLLGV